LITVSDTSPITNLAAIGQLALLRDSFKRLFIPAAVAAELSACPRDCPGYVDLAANGWIAVSSVRQRSVATALSMDLDVGEAEAIALALELDADIVLIDERRGRRLARRLGMRPLGLLGVLVNAKRDGLVEQIRPLIDALLADAGFWIGHDLYRRVLQEVFEG
jgi:hypothetical protein